MGSGVDHLSRNPSQRASFALAATGIARADFERVAANPPGGPVAARDGFQTARWVR